MSRSECDERVWFVHGPTGWTKFDREPGYAARASGKVLILGPLVPARFAGAVVLDDAAITRAADAIGALGTDRIGAEPYAAARAILDAARGR